MDEVGVEKTVILTGAIGQKFEDIHENMRLPIVSSSGAVLITRGMTDPDSAHEPYEL